jgi:hypothetical protein
MDSNNPPLPVVNKRLVETDKKTVFRRYWIQEY